MPNNVIKCTNRWCQGQKDIAYGDKLEFLNQVKQNFDQENEELDLDDLVEEKKVHHSIPAEISGVSLESDFEPILDTVVEVEPPASDEQVAQEALDNVSLISDDAD